MSQQPINIQPLSQPVHMPDEIATFSPAVEDEVRSMCSSQNRDVQRIGGATRQETAVRIADWWMTRAGSPVTHVNLARGDTFPDAIAGAAHGGHEQGPVLLSENADSLGSTTREFLRAHSSEINSIDAFGTSDALSDAVLIDAQQAATS